MSVSVLAIYGFAIHIICYVNLNRTGLAIGLGKSCTLTAIEVFLFFISGKNLCCFQFRRFYFYHFFQAAVLLGIAMSHCFLKLPVKLKKAVKRRSPLCLNATLVKLSHLFRMFLIFPS